MSVVRIGGYEVTHHVAVRDESGRFLAAVHAGASAAGFELAEQVASLAKVFAPRRRGILIGSIRAFMVSATQGVAVADASHAAPQEKGAGPHRIPGAFGIPEGVMHPGNPATHFLQRAGSAVAALSAQVVRKNMPGV